MKRSSPPSELLDLERDLPITAEDVAALRRLRERPREMPGVLLEELARQWPSPPDVASRPTAEGREPFEL